MILHTWLGALWDSAVPDLMGELWPVVIHVDHIDHNINGVFNLVAIQVYCVSSQLEENTNMWAVDLFRLKLFSAVETICWDKPQTTHSESPITLCDNQPHKQSLATFNRVRREL